MLIFAHRGASAYCIENTIKSFKMAFEMNAGIETDIRLTKDEILVCFHDPYFKIGKKHYAIKNLTLKELRDIQFEDKRKIPTLKEVFECLDPSDQYKFSFDIGSQNAGKKIIKLAKEYALLNNIFITDTRLIILKALRRINNSVQLVHTVPHNIPKIKENNLDFQTLEDLNIKILNIKANKYIKENFSVVVNKGFKSFFWGVNSRTRMKKILLMNINGQKVDAIYTDYPDKLYELKKKYLN